MTLTVRAATQADDGLPLEDSAAWYGRSMADLPPRDQLAAHGVLVRSIGNPGLRLTPGGMTMPSQPGELRVEPAVLAYKVFPDGREELVRNAEISGLTASSFKDILAASKEQTLYTTQFRGRRLPTAMFIPEPSLGDASSVVVSYVVPSLLFEDVTLKKPSGEFPKPPVAPHPFFDK